MPLCIVFPTLVGYNQSVKNINSATNHSSFVFVSRSGSANILLTGRQNKRKNGTKSGDTEKHGIRLKALFFKDFRNIA